MYAGYLNVSLTPETDHNLFYWYFKNEKIENASLIIWINGGPGSSSMFGLFLENGPINVKKIGSGADDYQIGLTAESWADLGDMVFID